MIFDEGPCLFSNLVLIPAQENSLLMSALDDLGMIKIGTRC